MSGALGVLVSTVDPDRGLLRHEVVDDQQGLITMLLMIDQLEAYNL